MRKYWSVTLVIISTFAALPAAFALGVPTGPDESVSAAAARIDEMAGAGDFSGVVLIARDGEMVFEKAVGLARREERMANSPNIRYNIGSITKVFTRVMITQLESEGRLEMSDTIARHLPDYPDSEIAHKVTIEQLLAMTSGLGDIFGDRYDATPKDEIVELDDYLNLFAGQPLQFEPGSSRAYSNAGYIVLGLIVEKITGMSYGSALAERVFEPAGMKGSAILPRSDLPADTAIGYTRNGWLAAMRGGDPPTGDWEANWDSLPGRGSSAGGTYSKARDLLAFDRALEVGTLCDDTFFREHGGSGFAGGAPGINAVLESDWATGWTIVVMANSDPPAAMNLAREMRAIFNPRETRRRAP
jgi:CubicO group peptidase (beta-lactamase class C family)